MDALVRTVLPNNWSHNSQKLNALDSSWSKLIAKTLNNLGINLIRGAGIRQAWVKRKRWHGCPKSNAKVLKNGQRCFYC